MWVVLKSIHILYVKLGSPPRMWVVLKSIRILYVKLGSSPLMWVVLPLYHMNLDEYRITPTYVGSTIV